MATPQTRYFARRMFKHLRYNISSKERERKNKVHITIESPFFEHHKICSYELLTKSTSFGWISGKKRKSETSNCEPVDLWLVLVYTSSDPYLPYTSTFSYVHTFPKIHSSLVGSLLQVEEAKEIYVPVIYVNVSLSLSLSSRPTNIDFFQLSS